MKVFPNSPLIMDTSVLINLYKCTYGKEILAAIPNDIVIATVVAEELDTERSRRSGEQQFLEELVSSGKVEVIGFDADESELFGRLASGSIDDGEAATVAIASNRKLFAVIDDLVGRGVASSVTGLEPAWSLDLLLHDAVQLALGMENQTRAVHLALREGRMRICDSRVEEIIALIGVERASECKCLPGYKFRFGSKTLL